MNKNESGAGYWWTSCQYNASNAVNLNNGGFNNNNKTNSNNVFCAYEIDKTTEWVTLKEVYAAYRDCRRRKMSSQSYSDFVIDEANNIYTLYQELNNGTYEIGKSITFCVTRPKVREVFAANFRDRIVHHLLMMKVGHLFEEHFIDESYNCRVGKGNMYGAFRLYDTMQKYPTYWNVKMDMQGFFYSINKQKLYDMLEKFLRERYKEKDIEQVLWVTKKIVMHEPQFLCEKRGDKELWDKLPKERSLFTCKSGYGLAIGNLTSQIFANFYLSYFDLEMEKRYGDRYKRYVDDIIVTLPHEDIPEMIEFVRRYLRDELEVTLHQRKIYIQQVSKGVKFIGFATKRDRIYTNSTTVDNATQAIRLYNDIEQKEHDVDIWVDKFAARINSYLGFMLRTKSYAIRWNLWNEIDEEIKKRIYMRNMCCIVVRKKYKQLTKIKEEYVKECNANRRMEQSGTCLQAR